MTPATTAMKQGVIGLCVGLALCLAALPARAATVTYQLNYIFSPQPGTVSPQPLATVTLNDGTPADTFVDFTVMNLAGAGTRFDSLYFNFSHGSFNPNQLTFSSISATAGTYSTLLAATTTSTSPSLRADGDGYYDGLFQYTGPNFLANGQTLSFRLSLAGQNLNVTDFDFLSLPGPGFSPGSFTMASHVQSLPGGASVWVGTPAPVPVPAAIWLFGSGVASLIPMMRRRLMRGQGRKEALSRT